MIITYQISNSCRISYLFPTKKLNGAPKKWNSFWKHIANSFLEGQKQISSLPHPSLCITSLSYLCRLFVFLKGEGTNSMACRKSEWIYSFHSPDKSSTTMPLHSGFFKGFHFSPFVYFVLLLLSLHLYPNVSSEHGESSEQVRRTKGHWLNLIIPHSSVCKRRYQCKFQSIFLSWKILSIPDLL